MPLVPLSADDCDYLAGLVERDMVGKEAHGLHALRALLVGHAEMARKPLVPNAED